ncbi:MAG: tRNA pseudouridine(55) synthase TruB [Acholeplasmatales bacterium]|nr:tRNA pseudouridine(55) synthase TruB [Acholeplasmatales bacterium]
MDGFIFVDKPKGMTSQRVCSIIKKKLNIDKVGHSGTLDPNTTGIMLIALGRATKLLKLLNEHDKKYVATITLGFDSDTLDFDGNITNEIKMESSMDDIKCALDDIKSSEFQYPPMTSSVKINGMKLYEYQRKNIDVEIKPRNVKLYDYKILSEFKLYNNHKEFDLEISCSKGYYVRSLARDLGLKLNGCAILHELRRISIGQYDINRCKLLDDITENDVISIFDFFDLKKVEVDDYMKKLVLNGVTLDSRNTSDKGIFYVTNKCDIIAIYEEYENNTYKPIIIFK